MSRFVKAFIKLTLLVALLGVVFYVYAMSPFLQGVVGLAIRIAAPKTADAATNVEAIPTQTYTVRQNDTPFGVALQYGTDVETLIALNKEKYPGIAAKPMQFNAGWMIRVPASGGGPVTAAEGGGQVALPTIAPAIGGGYFDYDAALEIVRLTNEERARYGLSQLAIDEGLMEVARRRATEIVSNFSHDGVCQCAENIAQTGNAPASTFVSMWINSPGHHENILRDWAVRIGVGVYRVGWRTYAVQEFQSPNDVDY